ncbi:hypothetical protein CWE12_10340 [Aliidiomarina sedimenti]|uniref:Uncharacterized protein n=1 Tax=Aliidiomarina sedimenti TaxID=1933879 RepID=A0ABY0BY08_9GAMM|nr:hypothetical protein [Aliidiomarina sedimenti]RUO29368.1 hypothetical protein CWE12_10340 [Aliidiomarina sedimenti]
MLKFLLKNAMLVALLAVSASLLWSWTDSGASSGANTTGASEISLLRCPPRQVVQSERTSQSDTKPLCGAAEQVPEPGAISQSQLRFELRAPRSSFSFHYLDILEWLFTVGSDPQSKASQFH